MARIRTVKPELFRHEELFELEQNTGLPIRISFIALFTVCDREGRFKWRPRQLKLDCLPYDEVDFLKVLETLMLKGFINKYEVDGEFYGLIPTFTSHQVINLREAQSIIPAPVNIKKNKCEKHVHARAYTLEESANLNGINIPQALRETVFLKDNCKCVRCESEEDLTVDHIFPQSIGGTHLLTNLRTLCRSCNSARPVQGEALLNDLARDGLTMEDMKSMCMHMRAHGEGKGREKEREGEREGVKEVASAPRSPAQDTKSSKPEKQLTETELLKNAGIDGQLAKDFLKVRKAKNAPITETAVKGILREAKIAGITPIQAVQICIDRNWQGFNAGWDWQSTQKNKSSTGQGKNSGSSSQATRNISHENFRDKDYGKSTVNLPWANDAE
jgi:hypothetical protein